MKNTGLINLHSFTGLFAGLFILALSLSGTILVFRDSIDAFQRPIILPTKVAVKKITVDSCYKIMQSKYPHALISSCAVAENEQQPFSFFIYDSSYKAGTKTLQIFLHPQTGAVLTTRGGSEDVQHNFMSWLAIFHNSFHAGKTGEWLLGFFAIIFALSIITGIILYRKNIIAVLLFRKSVFKKNNLHQLIGTWALLFNLIMAVTGFWMQRYVFKKEFYQNSDWVNTIKPSPNLFFNFDSAYTSLQKQYPDFTGYVIYFAQSEKGKTAIYGSNNYNAFIHSKNFADVIALDSSGAIAKTRFINEISADDRYDIINSQLHMGKYGGAGIKIIYAFFGLSSALLSITGFLLWVKRRRK
ncbi:PepSY-associated TM helix domain-containing protein [Ferruginibacter sp.]|nr:PepSY domain-containing protein [Ferruginibacter sp.]